MYFVLNPFVTRNPHIHYTIGLYAVKLLLFVALLFFIDLCNGPRGLAARNGMDRTE
jgi:hypothetical protein